MSTPPSHRTMTPQDLAKRIQFTLVDPRSTRADVERHVQACAEHGFDAAMIPMCWVPLAREILKGTGVKVATFVGIGMGNESTHAKVALLRECWALGADEVDIQPNMGFFLSDMTDAFQHEAVRLVEAAEGRTIKAMLELGYIAEEPQKRLAARLLAEAGFPWVKNSSGAGPASEPASVENMRLLRSAVGDTTRVKGSGKVRSYPQVLELLEAGADLVGSSAGVEIMQGSEANTASY